MLEQRKKRNSKMIVAQTNKTKKKKKITMTIELEWNSIVYWAKGMVATN